MLYNGVGVLNDKIKSFYNKEAMNVGFVSQLNTNSIPTNWLAL